MGRTYYMRRPSPGSRLLRRQHEEMVRHGQRLGEIMNYRSAYAYLDVTDPLVAWLTYRGEMVAAGSLIEGALSFWAAGRLRNKELYLKELALESQRSRSFPASVSRLSGFYVFDDLDSARAAAERWGVERFRPDTLVEVGIVPGSRVSRYDAEWITRHFNGSGDIDWGRHYFAGISTDSPIWELVVDGRAIIYGTEVREAAYEVIVAKWPKTKCLLELARLAAHLDSDLGLIVAWPVRDGEVIRVHFIMHFEDAMNEEFLKRTRDFKGPVNVRDLYPFEPVTPDLRDREFVLT
jgi:hypothetical protein